MKENFIVRFAETADIPAVAAMCAMLWPDASETEHAQGLSHHLSNLIVAQETGGRLIGFIDVGLRSHADGCDPSHAVGFIEGWFVATDWRRRKVGARLVEAAEEWARRQGCREMASDTWVDRVDPQRAHQALGYEEVDRCVHYRKRL